MIFQLLRRFLAIPYSNGAFGPTYPDRVRGSPGRGRDPVTGSVAAPGGTVASRPAVRHWSRARRDRLSEWPGGAAAS
eukprot:746923-Hanusia_phi.AAC.2